MENNRDFLATEPVGKLLWKLALPTVIAQLINMLYNIVDRIYIGHMPGDGNLALTGVGVCLPIIMIGTAFAALVASGGAPRASIFMGKKDPDMAEKILGECFVLQLLISVVLTIVLLVWNRPLLLSFGASVNTVSYASDYLSVYAIGTVFVQLTLGMNAFITAQGKTRIAMVTVLIGAILNIVLDPIFIFALGMGVRGAALATILSQCVSCTWCVLYLCSSRSTLRLRPGYFRLTPKIILPCIALGTAAFVMQSSESIINVCFNSSLLKYGGDMAVGAMTICSTVFQFAGLPMQGVGQGAQPISGYNYGAGNAGRVRRTFRLLLTANLTYSVLLGLVIHFFPELFASVFTDNSELIAYAGRALRIYCGGIFLFGIQSSCQNTFVSMGKAVSSITVAVVRKFVLLLPLIYLMPHLLNDSALAVYTAEPVADVLAITFTSILFSIQFRAAMKQLEFSSSSFV